MTSLVTVAEGDGVRPLTAVPRASAQSAEPEIRLGRDRRGRPHRITEERSSRLEVEVDVDARVGWLLIMSRLHHADTELTQGGHFLTALEETGLRASRSAVSRWESGSVSTRYGVLTAYERALRMPPGQISSVVSALRRVYGPKVVRGWTPEIDPFSESFAVRLDALLDVLISGEATGQDWVEFGHYVAAAGALYIHGSVWFELAQRLVDELVRSVGLAHLQRSETIRILLTHPVAGSWLLQASREYLLDPAMPVVHDKFDVPALASITEAADYLSMLAVRHEPESLAEVTPQTALKVSQQIADEVRARLPASSLYDQDEMTPRILREAMFSDSRVHRHLARLMLFSSPFRLPLAVVLTRQIGSTSLDEVSRTAMARLLRYVAGPEEEPMLLHAIPTAQAPVALEMTLTLGHIPRNGMDMRNIIPLLDKGEGSLDRAIMYAAGMRGDESLSRIAMGSSHPAPLRNAAVWWLRKGRAVRA